MARDMESARPRAMPDIERFQRPAIADVLSRAGMDTGETPWRTAPSGWRRGPCAICRSGNQRAFAYREDSGRWRCFECGAGGNVWDLVMALEGCDFDQALALWRAPGEPPGPPEDERPAGPLHDTSMTPGITCPACKAMWQAGSDGATTAAAHDKARAVGNA
jgi:hypothetical protein